MARVDVQTDDDGNNEIALIISNDEIKMIISTWDIPLTVKQALIEAKSFTEETDT